MVKYLEDTLPAIVFQSLLLQTTLFLVQCALTAYDRWTDEQLYCIVKYEIAVEKAVAFFIYQSTNLPCSHRRSQERDSNEAEAF